MGGLLDALLDISKLDGGAIVPKKRDVRLQEILERIFTGNIQQAEEKGLELIRTEHDCVVHSDPGLLERIVENYVANAIRYTESGRVSIECRPVGNSIKIVVSDTGVGIAAGELEKVFDEYYQLDNPVRDLRKGLGLGLSIVRLIAKLLDHPIDVSSTPGKGSSFFVEVPLGEEKSERAAAPAQVQTAPSDRREPIVLFVDDDPAIVDATTMLLKLSGFQVHSALCGSEALAHVANGIRPDVIVTDYRLPGLSGIEVVRQVRERMGETTPTVLMTGDTSSKEIALAGLPECTVLHKPVDTDQLVSLMEFLTA
jgi:CheY-like chemotaxis protein